PTEPYSPSLHDALPIWTHARNACRILPASLRAGNVRSRRGRRGGPAAGAGDGERDVRPAAARGRAAPARRTAAPILAAASRADADRKSTRLNSSHGSIS